MNEADIYDARSAFVDHYCALREWDANTLTGEQVAEIRAQPEWNDPSFGGRAEAETVVRRKGNDLFIYEEGEFCCVCKGTDYDALQMHGFGDPADPLKFMVCVTCWGEDGLDGAFHRWLVGEFERTMIVHDENRKLPDGKWTTRKHDPV